MWRCSQGSRIFRILAAHYARIDHDPPPDGALVDAQIPKAGDQSAGVIVTRHNIADQVQITRKSTGELKSLKLLRRSSAQELEAVVTSLAWRKAEREENLLKAPIPAAKTAGGLIGAGQVELENARRVGLERGTNMPNFVADETAERYVSPHRNPPSWKLFDTIISEVTFHNGNPTRQHVRINGKPWNKTRMPGFSFGVDFGTSLTALFDPECGNSFDFLGREDTNGMRLLAFGFGSPSHGCFGYYINGEGIRYIPLYKGRILVDDPGGNVIQFESEAIDLLKGLGLDSLKGTERWEYFKIGGASYLLPVSEDSVLGFVPGDLWRLNVTYTNHRHFEASTNIKFNATSEK